MKIKYITIYGLAFLIGFFISGEFTGLMQKIKKTNSVDWIDNGKISRKITFKENSSGLYSSDKTITDADTSIIDTPELAGKIAVAIMEDVFDSITVSDNYPFEIYKDIYSWDISGLCLKKQEEENVMYFDLSKEIVINRKNGMVTFLSH